MTQARRIIIVLGLNLGMLSGLIAVGLTSHSLGILAAGGDYLLDAGACILGLIAIRIRDRSKGKSKATSIVALINASLLLLISIGIVVEGVSRLFKHSYEIHAQPVIWTGAIAALAMVVGAFVLRGDDDEDDLHIRSVFLDTIADALSAAGITVAAVVILITKRFYWLDPAIAILISAAISYHSIALLGKAKSAV